MESSPNSSRIDRKTTERNRRNQMKALFNNLNFLIPHHTSKERLSLSDQIDNAAKYIKKLQTNLEKMKEKKDNLIGNNDLHLQKPKANKSGSRNRSPQIEIHQFDSALEVILITGLDHQFMFNETIHVLHEEGAEVVNASFSVVDDTIFHSFHSQLGDSTSSYAAERISERLNKFLVDSTAF